MARLEVGVAVAILSELDPQDEAYALQQVSSQLHTLAARLDELEARIDQRAEGLRNQLGTVTEALELLYDDDAGARRRLREMRAAAAYGEAFSDPNPLVSVVIPTWNRVETLIERAIPSALAQTHANIEVVVVGDASPPQTAEAIAMLGDDRVAFHNLTLRGPYSEDRKRAWLASGTPGLNAGAALARGSWIAPLGDDDAFVPRHIEQLLELARRRRLEFAYGLLRMNTAAGGSSLLGEFPPRLGQIGLQAVIYHAGLSAFMELELGHAVFGKPNDWGFVQRMMRAGVRMGMLDEVTADYFPSPSTQPPQPG